MGAKVTLVQSGPTLLDRVDQEAGALLAESLEGEGVDVRAGHAADHGRGRRPDG